MSYFVLHCVRGKIFHPGITASIYPSRPPSWVTPISSQQLERLALRCSPKETTTSCQPKKQPTSCLLLVASIHTSKFGLGRLGCALHSGRTELVCHMKVEQFPTQTCRGFQRPPQKAMTSTTILYSESDCILYSTYTMCFDSCCLLFSAQPQTCIVVSIFCFRGEYETSTLWARMSFGRKKLHNRTRE